MGPDPGGASSARMDRQKRVWGSRNGMRGAHTAGDCTYRRQDEVGAAPSPMAMPPPPTHPSLHSPYTLYTSPPFVLRI